MKVYITGCNGKIGSAILKFLSKNDIICVANYRKKSKKFKFKNVQNHYCNILDKSFQVPSSDILIHCAGNTPKNNELNLDKNFQINKKINNVLKTNKSIKKLIFLSSAAIYSKYNYSRKVNEKTKRISNTKYAVDKLKAEKLFLKNRHIEVYNIRIPAIIFTNKEKNFFTNLIKDIKMKKQIYLYNPKQLFNNLLSVDDLNIFILNLIQNKYKSGNILLGGKNPISLKKITYLIHNYFSKKREKIIWKQNKKSGFYLDINNAVANYKFKPIKTEESILLYLKNKFSKK